MEINELVIFMAGFLAGGGVCGLFIAVVNLRKRVKQLEQSGPPSLPFKSRDEIENGIAALNYLYFNRMLENEAIENALSHLQKARNPDKEP